MKKRRSFRIYLAVAALSVLSAPASASDWMVRKIEGTVLYDIDGKPGSVITAGDALAPGTGVRTGPGSAVTLEREKSTIIVRENTIASLLEGKPTSDPRLLVQWGGIEATLATAPATLLVETPTLLATAVNASFALQVSTTSSEVWVKAGSMNVLSAATLEERPVGAGETVLVSSTLEEMSAKKKVAKPRMRRKRSKSFLESLGAFPSKTFRGLAR